jgi:MFS family permease
LVARGMVGIGEAAYTPAGAAVITAAFPKEVRARVQGSFDIGMFIGGATGISLGGYIASQLGWRAAFFMVGIPGLILALAALRLPESVVSVAKESMSLRELLRVPAFLALLVSGFFCSFAGYSYVVWGPDLVQEKGFSAAQASMALGVTIVLGGMLGIATGAYLSDLLAKVRAWGRAAIVPLGFVLATPAIYFALYASEKIHFLLLFGVGTFFLSWYHGPLTATIHDLVPPRGHATALGFYYLFVNLFSMAIAPVVIGKLADRHDLAYALHIPIIAQLIGAAFFIVVIQCIRHDGLRHPALARYWEDEPNKLPATNIALVFEQT